MSEFFSLKNQVAVVTGGTSGIGLKTAERFIAAGAKVVISGRKDGTEIAEKIGAKFVQCDVGNPDSVKGMMEFAVENYGKIDIIVNNAGANFGYDTLMDTDLENFDKNFGINRFSFGCASSHKMGDEILPTGIRHPVLDDLAEEIANHRPVFHSQVWIRQTQLEDGPDPVRKLFRSFLIHS